MSPSLAVVAPPVIVTVGLTLAIVTTRLSELPAPGPRRLCKLSRSVGELQSPERVFVDEHVGRSVSLPHALDAVIVTPGGSADGVRVACWCRPRWRLVATTGDRHRRGVVRRAVTDRGHVGAGDVRVRGVVGEPFA